jgi:hypothetical protein
MPQSLPEANPAELQPSGFDRAPTFRAYEQQLPALSEAMAATYSSSTPAPRDISDADRLIVISHDEIERLWGLFPEVARTRALPTRLQSDGPQWFSNVSGATPELTEQLSEAISPTSFALGVTQYLWDREEGGLRARVVLYQTPEASGFGSDVQRVSQAKVAAHEFAHTIITPDLNVKNVELVLPGGRRVDPAEFLFEFYLAAINYPAISDYSSAYRREGFTEDPGKLKATINEELADSIAAYLLGFTVSPEDQDNPPTITFRPFEGREDVRTLVHDYLHAQRVLADL